MQDNKCLSEEECEALTACYDVPGREDPLPVIL